MFVGDGGEGGTSIRSPVTEINGSSGDNSVFASIEAFGGGGGYASRGRPTLSTPSKLGGNKVSVDSSEKTASTGGIGGFGGGGGGGGGGNTRDGSNGVNTTGGNGGDGSDTISISGSAVIYGVGGRGADAGIFNAAVSWSTKYRKWCSWRWNSIICAN